MIFLSARHTWPERAGFQIDRPRGIDRMTFLHFHGSVEILLNGETIKTQPHACVLYMPGVPQFFRSDRDMIHDWFHYSGESEERIRGFGIEPNTVFYPKETGFITSIVGEMEREINQEPLGYDRLLSLLLDELYIKLGRSLVETPAPRVSPDLAERLRTIRSEMLSDLKGRRSVREMADAAGLSESRFFAVYKALFGESPVDGLISARINSARNMLSFTDKPAAEIAAALGYANLTHFMRQFRSLTGMTPAEWRKKTAPRKKE